MPNVRKGGPFDTACQRLLGGSLLAGRLAHAVLLSSEPKDNLGRILGMTSSQVAILGGAVLTLLQMPG